MKTELITKLIAQSDYEISFNNAKFDVVECSEYGSYVLAVFPSLAMAQRYVLGLILQEKKARQIELLKNLEEVQEDIKAINADYIMIDQLIKD